MLGDVNKVWPRAERALQSLTDTSPPTTVGGPERRHGEGPMEEGCQRGSRNYRNSTNLDELHRAQLPWLRQQALSGVGPGRDLSATAERLTRATP